MSAVISFVLQHRQFARCTPDVASRAVATLVDEEGAHLDVGLCDAQSLIIARVFTHEGPLDQRSLLARLDIATRLSIQTRSRFAFVTWLDAGVPNLGTPVETRRFREAMRGLSRTIGRRRPSPSRNGCSRNIRWCTNDEIV